MVSGKNKEVEAYLKLFSSSEQALLEELRQIIHSVGEFEECISYKMPAFRYKEGIAAGFLLYRHHIGFYPFSGATLRNFKEDIKSYKSTPGALQLSREKKLPRGLIKKIVRARMKEIDQKSTGKTAKSVSGRGRSAKS